MNNIITVNLNIIKSFDTSDHRNDENLDTIIEFSTKLINNEIKYNNDKELNKISERLYQDFFNLIMLNNINLSNHLFSIIGSLLDYYKEIYSKNQSSIARLFQGKYSCLKDLYECYIVQNKINDWFKENYEIKLILCKANHQGLCQIKKVENPITKDQLNYLNIQGFISISELEEYNIKLTRRGKYNLFKYLDNVSYNNYQIKSKYIYDVNDYIGYNFNLIKKYNKLSVEKNNTFSISIKQEET